MPGGVGLMTRAMLLTNVVELAEAARLSGSDVAHTSPPLASIRAR